MEPKGFAGSEDFVAEVAGIFKTLYVLLNVSFDGYTLLQGNTTSNTPPRVSMLVQDCLEFEQFVIDSEVPTVSIKIGEFNVVGVYHEWGLQGDKDQKTHDVDDSFSGLSLLSMN